MESQMSRKQRHIVIYVLTSFLFTILFFDGLLRWFDPWGVNRQATDSRMLLEHIIPDSRRTYELAPGTYQYSNWTTTILPDGSRLVPNTNQAANCTLVLAGDSVTFGYGVSDSETWANVLARKLSNIRIINAGVYGYNAAEALKTIQAFPSADFYLYMYIPNDGDDPQGWQYKDQATRSGYLPSLMSAYIFIALGGAPQQPVRPFFWPTIAQINSHPNVIMFGVSGVGSADDLRDRYPASRWIPAWTGTNSRSDAHPNPKGHQEIAESIYPFVRTAAQKWCGLI
jgi:hypothetical protein